MRSDEIRKRFLTFFEKRGHIVIPSASLVPENDPSVLFNTAGMQPLVPYLLGEVHPKGTRLVDVQKCVRTNDIEEVGDNIHHTFFEMLGNWSLGDYFKKEAINWSYEFLTDTEEGLGLDPKRLYVTVFEGDTNAPQDDEAYALWKEIFEAGGLDPEKRIFFMGADDNWWSPGDNGPCGPDTEMFYDVTNTLRNGLTREEFLEADEKQYIVEIWNDVFMEYEKKDGVVVGKLAKKNVDTGAGFERLTAVVQGVPSAYETDLFKGLMDEAQKHTTDVHRQRTIADHARASVFLIADGVKPSNTDQGYVLRRLIRRIVMQTDARALDMDTVTLLVDSVVAHYGNFYLNIKEKADTAVAVFGKEVEQFEKTLQTGLKEFEKAIRANFGKKLTESSVKILAPERVFNLITTRGLPEEVIRELAQERNIEIDWDHVSSLIKAHQDLSRTSSAGKFKGGLGDTSEMSIKYHTATHLLNAGLRHVLGEHVEQKGSNITPERLRFDFSHGEKLTDEEKQKVTEWVNEIIQKNLPVTSKELSIEKARELRALGVFGDKYDDIVRVYTVGNIDNPASREICGGPHVENTGELGVFRITKEEASSTGVRRIKAVLE
jgi:alanyl-tRNA synthetase